MTDLCHTLLREAWAQRDTFQAELRTEIDKSIQEVQRHIATKQKLLDTEAKLSECQALLRKTIEFARVNGRNFVSDIEAIEHACLPVGVMHDKAQR